MDERAERPMRLVTVAAAPDAVRAHGIRVRLEAADIPCVIADEYTMSANPFYNFAVGGVKVQVREQDAARAAALLNAPPEPLPDEEPESEADETPPAEPAQPGAQTIAPACPRCGAAQTVPVRRGLLFAAFAVLLWTAVGLLPWPFARMGLAVAAVPFAVAVWLWLGELHVCRACGHRWAARVPWTGPERPIGKPAPARRCPGCGSARVDTERRVANLLFLYVFAGGPALFLAISRGHPWGGALGAAVFGYLVWKALRPEQRCRACGLRWRRGHTTAPRP